MEEEKSLEPSQTIDALQALAKDSTAKIPESPDLRRTLLHYKDLSRKRPAPSFVGKRMY